MRSLAVLEVREGEALTYKRKTKCQHQFSEWYIVLQTACVMTICTIWEIKTQHVKAHLSVPQT